jgi:hypothetical protein
MRRLASLVLLIAFLVSPQFGGLLLAQAAPPTPQQLDQLLAPVALYPDSLLAQITTASTNPQEILDVDNWLHQNQGLTGQALTDAAEQQGFDPAFMALVNFPQVLDMMAQNIDDYAAIGQAFQADQGSVTASIQRLRAQAYASGALRSTPQQQVVIQQAAQPIYVIQPASASVVYVPQYDPTVVYVRPSTGLLVATAAIGFGVGIAIGALLSPHPWGWGGWGWDWRGRRAYYNHGYWGGWGPHPYRPPHAWYHPRPVPWANRPGYGGRWNYRPDGYRPPYQRARGYRPTPYRPNNGYRPPANRAPNQPARPYRPNRPATNPAPRPGESNRPGSNQPRTPAGTHNNPNTNPHPRRGRTNRQNEHQPSKSGGENRPAVRQPSKRENRPAAKPPAKEHAPEKHQPERKKQ